MRYSQGSNMDPANDNIFLGNYLSYTQLNRKF